MYQQGDVLLIPDAIPVNAKRVNMRPLAEGEVTGHAHRVETPEACELYEDGESGRVLLRVLAGDVRVVHEEHGPVTLPVGDYEVRKVLEYDHFTEESRIVAD